MTRVIDKLQIPRTISSLKIIIFRIVIDPTYEMTYEERKRYYKEKDTREQRAHEEKIAHINANVHVTEHRQTTYENMNIRYR